MSNILCIETSTKSCSAALGSKGTCIASAEFISDQFAHAEKLHPMIREIMEKADLKMSDLHAVSVSRGPGSFTGLRIGVAAAKGLCFSLGIPLLSIDTLELMYHQALQQKLGMGVYIPMIDARRMEVFMKIFNTSTGEYGEVEARIIDEHFFEQFKNERLYIFGDGSLKFRHMLGANHVLIPDICPSAAAMTEASETRLMNNLVEDIAYFEPYYLKDFIAGIRKLRQ